MNTNFKALGQIHIAPCHLDALTTFIQESTSIILSVEDYSFNETQSISFDCHGTRHAEFAVIYAIWANRQDDSHAHSRSILEEKSLCAGRQSREGKAVAMTG